MTSFLNNVSDLSALQGVMPGVTDKNARVLALVHVAVPCRAELLGEPAKCFAIPITILEVLRAGFAVAPYTMPKKGCGPVALKAGEVTENLFHLNTLVSPAELEVLSYEGRGLNRGSAVGGVKAPGDDSTVKAPMYTIKNGMTFVYFVNNLTFQSSTVVTPLPTDCDYIPALSVVELLIAPRNAENCLQKGRGVNVKSMRLSSTTLDAYFKNGIVATALASTALEAKNRAMAHQEMYPAILHDEETEKLCFTVSGSNLKQCYMADIVDPSAAVAAPAFVKVEDSAAASAVVPAVVSAAPAFVKVFVGGGTASFPSCDYLDMPIEVLQKQTNTSSNEHASALLDIAFAMGAVDLLVTSDERLLNKGASPYHCIPVINTRVFFSTLDRIRKVESDHAMVASINPRGEYVFDEDGIVVLERVELEAKDGRGSTITIATGDTYDGGKLFMTVSVIEEDLTETRPKWDAPQKNPALALVGPGVKTTLGYYFRIDVRNAAEPANDVRGIFVGYINQASGSSSTTRKRKSIELSMGDFE